jgi:hypothetical protein
MILSLFLVQALELLRKDENNNVNMEEAIDFVNNQLSIDQTEGSSVQQTQGGQDQRLPSTPNPPSSTPANDSHLNQPDQNDLQVPSDLVSRCIATLLMIQVKILNPLSNVRTESHLPNYIIRLYLSLHRFRY